jgi:hypothetical protein
MTASDQVNGLVGRRGEQTDRGSARWPALPRRHKQFLGPRLGRRRQLAPAHRRSGTEIFWLDRWMESLGLADVLPSAAAAVGAPWPNPLGVPTARVVVVVVLDGLGWVGLRDNADVAPFLSSLDGRPLVAGFPTTTATSLASIGTGRPPAEHGIVGYTTLLAEAGEPINWLRWRGARSGKDLLDVVPPERIQPAPTVFERAAEVGIASAMVAAGGFRASGLTRAVLRGASYEPVATPADAVATIASGARAGSPRILYAYLGDQDLIGHKYGPSSDPWRMQLALIDRTLAMLADRLPAGVAMVVTADHGMVDAPEEMKVDYDAEPCLKEDVLTVAGEGRARFIHTVPGSAAAVAERWRERLGAGVGVMTTDEIAGWLGPEPPRPAIRARLGDLVAVSLDRTTVVRRRAERYLATMRGQHGARTDEELLVPLLTHYSTG